MTGSDIGRRRGRRVLWISLAVIVPLALVMAGAAGYGLNSLTASAQKHDEAVRTLEATRVHNNDVDDQLRSTPSFTALGGTTSDTKNFGDQVAAYSAKLKSASSIVAADLASLRGEDRRLKSFSKGPLASLTRGQYDQDVRRIEAMIDALDAAGSVIAIASDQVAYLEKLLVVLDALGQAETKTEQNDIAGALAAYSKVDPAVQALQAVSGGPNISPQMKGLTRDVGLLADDFKVALQAIQAKDGLGLRAADQRINEDITSVEAFDEKGFEAWESNLLTPYRDRYERGVKAAGFTLQT